MFSRSRITPAILLASLWILFALFHLRPWRLSFGYVYGGDDRVYLAHLSTMVIDRDLQYANENAGSYLLYPVGSSLLSLPGYLAGYAADRLLHQADALRGSRDYSNTWTIVGYLLNQEILVVLGCILLYRLMRQELACGATASTLAVLGVMTSHLALYAFRRPMAHDGQFFVNALFLYWYFYSLRRQTDTWITMGAGAALAALVISTRWDNVPIVLIGFLVPLLPVLKSSQGKPARSRQSVVLKCVFYATVTIGLFWALQGPIWWNQFHTLWPFQSAYMPVVSSRLAAPVSAAHLQFLGHIFYGLDFGLFWTAPILPIGYLVAVSALQHIFSDIPPKRRRVLIIFHVVVLFGISLFQVMKWRSQASYYGYRYLTGALVPASIFSALVLEKSLAWPGARRQIVRALALAVIAIGALTAIPFEGNRDTLTLSMGVTAYGATGWINNRYSMNAWKALRSPTTLLRALAAGPLGVPAGLYWGHQPKDHVPEAVRPLQEKYAYFQSASLSFYVCLATFLLLLPAGLFLCLIRGDSFHE